jgi:hypothetical protein
LPSRRRRQDAHRGLRCTLVCAAFQAEVVTVDHPLCVALAELLEVTLVTVESLLKAPGPRWVVDASRDPLGGRGTLSAKGKNTLISLRRSMPGLTIHRGNPPPGPPGMRTAVRTIRRLWLYRPVRSGHLRSACKT